MATATYGQDDAPRIAMVFAIRPDCGLTIGGGRR